VVLHSDGSKKHINMVKTKKTMVLKENGEKINPRVSTVKKSVTKQAVNNDLP
jgi:hypothetical protein